MNLPVPPETASSISRPALDAKDLLIRDALIAYQELQAAFGVDYDLQDAFRRLHVAQAALAAIEGVEPKPTKVTFTYQVEETMRVNRDADDPLPTVEPSDPLSVERDARVDAATDTTYVEVHLDGGSFFGKAARLFGIDVIVETKRPIRRPERTRNAGQGGE